MAIQTPTQTAGGQLPGWYPDPSGRLMERWWDGSAWSDQTRPYAAPTAAAPTYAPLTPLPATAEKPPRGLGNGGIFVTWLFLGIFSLIFAFYSTRISGRAKWIWTGLVAAEIAAIVVIVVVAVRPGTGSVDTNAVQQFVTNSIPGSVTGAASAPSDETVTVQDVTCVQATSNTWACDATFHASAPSESISQNYSATLNVTCDATGSCTYPAFLPTPTQ
jgi:hypothetical protein